jgi:glycosyltransferase involved in cell wall biosynthesis
MKDTVSVMIPCFNHGHFLAETIESVLAQTKAVDEIIVIDDGSTDRTSQVASSYLDAIQYVYKANGGVSTALNAGIRRATGDWVCWLSADDLFMPNKIERQLEYVRVHPNVGLVYTDFYIVGEDANEIISRARSSTFPDRKTWEEQLLKTGCLFNGSTTMIRRTLFYKVGLFHPELLHSQDYNMWIRLAGACDFGFVPEPLVKYRWHKGNEEHREKPNEYRERARQLR